MSGFPHPVQSLWIGQTLSTMEQLCIASFLAHGHEFHLYVYDRPEALPKGVILHDADAILSQDSIFKYADRNTYAGFSNLFRYKLLLEKGGIWIDMDMVCLAPFNFPQDYVFAEQSAGEIASCVIKVPVGSQVMRNCYQSAINRGKGSVYWGETGPRLLQAAVMHSQLLDQTMDSCYFCPIPYASYNVLVQENTAQLLQTQLNKTYAVHLWNEMWRVDALDKDRHYAADSLYEVLRQRYLSPGSATTPGFEHASPTRPRMTAILRQTLE